MQILYLPCTYYVVTNMQKDSREHIMIVGVVPSYEIKSKNISMLNIVINDNYNSQIFFYLKITNIKDIFEVDN